MDDIVRQAMAKWPHVPHCSGWLGLDARGRWWLRDEAAQALGACASGVPGARGSVLVHEGLIAFIGRNYDVDAHGQWFFQNGPQRVFVELEAAPLVWRLEGDGQPVAHTGQPAREVRECLVDEEGRVYLDSDLGLGIVHSLDVPLVAGWIERGRWTPREVRAADLPAACGFVPSPVALRQK